HSERLAKLAGACAERMGLSRDEAAAVRLGAILHDVGKIGIPDRILRQSMALTEDEMAWMRRHPQIGADIIGPVEGLHHVAPLIRHHHEKFDGTGYPKGLKGEDIPLGSRIISVADAFEAMVADRIYRPSLGLNKALEEIKTGRGSHFDPRVVDAFLDLIATDTVHLPLPTKDQGQKIAPNRPDEPVQTAACVQYRYRSVEVAPGIFRLELPMPFELRHVNVYLLRDGDAYTLVDTGLQTEESRQVLNQQLAGLKVPIKRINRILITHIHPDHFGLAGELRERSGAELIIHRLEVALMEPRYARAEDLVHDVGKWLSLNGVPAEDAEFVKSASMGAREYVSVVEPDTLLEGAERLPVDDTEIEVVWTPGHSPGHCCFYWPARGVLLSGDHLLPK